MCKKILSIALVMMTCSFYPQKSNNQIDNQIKKQTKMRNAAILHEANEFVKEGKYEDFLTYCTEDTRWVFVGEQILTGKEEVRQYMKEFYWEPSVFTVDTTVERVTS